MIDKHSLRAEYGLDDYSLEYEIADQWLDRNVEPMVKKLAKIGQREYEFAIGEFDMPIESIRRVLETKGYGVLSWPIAHQPGFPDKQVKVRVLW